ncbi:hypothetical protein A1O3_10019 [Capronia epimyces CBS 606.96]|uniref:Uncharacterized protein n=1 Tax=Capronia epimyces CBS 606.96 TaxID=1182542 RepID=W9XKA9_9EURO|nr:uncharacterized protein A1O3_10019 [Capronia epimyces CBS 606.96]EXJ77790.1 hypothetical protein A1O3_10019 [Capronia epimyces CBS 606.96]
MASTASTVKAYKGSSDQQDVGRKSSTPGHTRRSSLEGTGFESSSASLDSPPSPIEQSFTYLGVSTAESPLPPLPNPSPALSLVINKINNLHTCPLDWSEYNLSEQDFEELQLREQRNEFGDRHLRYDYSPANRTFALRMPNGAPHEVLTRGTDIEVALALAQIPSQTGISSTAAEFVKGLCNRGSTTIWYPDPFSAVEENKKNIERAPDGSWGQLPMINVYPACIFEVANSQTTKCLENLAREYIFGTRGAVRTVVGFDLGYRTKKGAKMSTWRVKLNSEGSLIGITREIMVVCNKDGQRNQDPEAGLRLSLEDFAFSRPAGTLDGLEKISIFIPVSRLCDILEQGGESRGITRAAFPPPVLPHPARSSRRYNLRSRN